MGETLGLTEDQLEPEQLKRLEQYLATLRQGDLLHSYVFAVLGAPEATLNEDTREAAETADFRVTSVERRLPSGLWTTVSQTCDIRRKPAQEPFLQLAPLYDRGKEAWERARNNARSRAEFAYPKVEDLEHPVLDIRIIQTIEKTALVADGVEPFDPGLNALFRTTFATWLSRRFARHAFPNELENAVLRRLREQVPKRASDTSQPAGALLGSLEGVWVSYDRENADLLFVVRQDRVTRFKVFESDPDARLREGAQTLMGPAVKRNESQGAPYRLTWRVATANKIPADQILYRYHPLDLDTE